MAGGVQITATGRNERLMHVQRAGKRAADAAKIVPAFRQENLFSLRGLQGRNDFLFRAGKVREIVNVFRQIVHNFET